MDGYLLINKEKGYTSRDVVNIIGRELNMKKVGHTGTLDPDATGLLVICIGKGTKLIELLTNQDKEYIAEVTLGIKTDTGDITGNVLETKPAIIEKEQIVKVLTEMIGTYEQTVPIYSAVRVAGKKLYEYARDNKNVKLPTRLVDIKQLELISDVEENDNKTIFSIKTSVSKGTFIRSLIEDIAIKLNTIGTMSELKRTKVGQFDVANAINLNDIKLGNYEIKPIIDCLGDYKQVIVKDKDLLFKIKNGQKLLNVYNESEIVFINENKEVIALYQNDYNSNGYIRPWKMFIN